MLTDFWIHFKTRLKTLHSFMPLKTTYVNPIVTVEKFPLFLQKHKREREILFKPKNREIIHIIVYGLRMKYTFFIFCNITIWTIIFHRVPREASTTLNIFTIWLQLGRTMLIRYGIVIKLITYINHHLNPDDFLSKNIETDAKNCDCAKNWL